MKIMFQIAFIGYASYYLYEITKQDTGGLFQ